MFSFGIIAENFEVFENDIFVDEGFVCTSTSTLLLRKALQHTRGESYADNKARPEHRRLRALLFSCSKREGHWVGSLTSHIIVNNKELRDGAYSFIFVGRED